MRLTAAERRFALTSFAVKAAIFCIAQLVVCVLEPAATGVRLRGEGVPALPNQLRGDGFSGDPAATASLGPLAPLTKPTHHSAQLTLRTDD